jgi:hypothetical protein
MEKTAVDYAVEKLEKFISEGNQIAIDAILEKAKEMEKQQISKSFEDGKLNPFINTGELYYNENFNN